ncbi:hypothetical protein JZO86_14355 [Enterococcus ureasiticus]|uniref:hypothetical protein n=1 Tax=Enterococcus ureasiticus TaxID=903984 RepID=UPI001A8EF759|nr:hypothetical protein [Enterococcus ureasiticus]MBO0474881.1 hypothetical protein [Enterococcus ureasiticus]
MESLKNLTKARKDEVRKKVKELMTSEGKDYEEVQFENDLNYLLNNINKLENKKQGGLHQ